MKAKPTVGYSAGGGGCGGCGVGVGGGVHGYCVCC